LTIPRERTNGKVAAAQAQRQGRTRKVPPKDARPRYLQVASELKRKIADGTYAVGDRLPTEIELCQKFEISRYTARDAVRVLSSAGLITRRPRVGTVVVATPDDAQFKQDAASLRDLLQYAQDTQLRLVYVGRVALSKAQAREFGAQAGEEWIFALGMRFQDAADTRGKGKGALPICVTRLFLNPILKGIEARLRAPEPAIYTLIEREYKIAIERVEQDLQGTVLAADDAANLGTTPGAAALRVVRRFFSGDGKLLEVAESLHPSDRFTYHMQFRK